jgi:hypothetical protein
MGHLIKVYYPEAASGTVEVFNHGSQTSRADVFDDWDCTIPVADYSIDGSGRWKGWVRDLVDVRVKSASLLLIDEWTEGTEAALVGLESAGFTGTLADGSQGTGGDVQLAEVLDRIMTSFGAPNFYVRETGTSVDVKLKDALHSVRTTNFPFFVVTDAAYGAVGDGVTDDKAAIQRALDAAAAAGGGIVFFPGGKTYLLTGGLLVTANTVSLLGAGATSSVLKITTTNIVLLTFNAGVATFGGGFCAGLGFDCSSSAQTNAIDVVTAPGYTFERLRIRNFLNGINLQSKAIMRYVDFFGIAAGSAIASYAVWAHGSADGTLVKDCLLELGAQAFTSGRVVYVGVARVVVDSCDILHRSDGTIGVQVDTGPGKIVNCHFRRSAGAAGVTGTWIYAGSGEVLEDNNTFETGTTVYLFQDSSGGTAATVHRGSREKLRLTQSIAAGTATCNLEYGEHMITATGTPITVAVPVAAALNQGSPSGRMLVRYTVRNTTGAPVNVTNSAAGSGTHINGAVVAVPAGKSATWTLKFNEISATWDEVSFATG